MADVATPASIDMALGTTNDSNAEKTHKSKPEKPDEEKYKADLAKAEKEHAASQERLVCLSRWSRLPALHSGRNTVDMLSTVHLFAVTP